MPIVDLPPGDVARILLAFHHDCSQVWRYDDGLVLIVV